MQASLGKTLQQIRVESRGDLGPDEKCPARPPPFEDLLIEVHFESPDE